jgi:exo beta-1,2-glucooligosaccharide sophorohydrolase (non-reducing end)
MIVYLMAIASPTHPVPASMYYTGWAGRSDRAVQYRRGWSRTTQGDHYFNGNSYYGIKLDVGVGSGGDLFFTHFSFMGFDPRNKRDRYTNYFKNNRNLALINHAYAVVNPRNYVGYGDDSWGRSAGINAGGGHPTRRMTTERSHARRPYPRLRTLPRNR